MSNKINLYILKQEIIAYLKEREIIIKNLDLMKKILEENNMIYQDRNKLASLLNIKLDTKPESNRQIIETSLKSREIIIEYMKQAGDLIDILGDIMNDIENEKWPNIDLEEHLKTRKYPEAGKKIALKESLVDLLKIIQKASNDYYNVFNQMEMGTYIPIISSRANLVSIRLINHIEILTEIEKARKDIQNDIDTMNQYKVFNI